MNIHQAPAAMIEGMERHFKRVLTVQDLSREELIAELSKAWATLHWERQNNRVLADTVPKLALAIQKANTQGKGAEATKRHRDKAMKKAQELWKEIGHQFRHGGKPSKSSFADHILKNNLLPSKPDGKRWGKKAITDTWLKGL